jgi:hypothetical protein
MLKWAMSLPWWKIPRKTKHACANKDTSVTLTDGKMAYLKKNAFVSPVRKSYLPWGHPLLEYYDETLYMVADTPVGFCKIKLEDIDW